MTSPTARSLSGRSAFLELLASEGVDTLFGNPGTTELAIMEALGERSDIRYVLGLQEGVVLGMADGYARASGRLAACNVHVAPGLGNAMGSLYNAKFFGSPVLVTAGQQEQGHGLTEPLLYDPLVPIAQPLVKWAVECTRVEDLPRIVRRAAKIALTPPTGPVFLSLPGDVLDGEAALDLGHPTRVELGVQPTDDVLDRLADSLLSAQRPLLVAGHELATRDALTEAEQLAETLGAPVVQQTVAYGAHFRSEHPAYLGGLTRTQAKVRAALEPHDVLVFLGADVLRMSVHSPLDAMPQGKRVIQISERDGELGKNYPAELAVRADVKATLSALVRRLRARMSGADKAAAASRLAGIARNNWSARRDISVRDALKLGGAVPINPSYLMMVVADAIPADAVVVEEGLTSTFSLLDFLRMRDHQGFYGLASGGIGFACAGAVGISLALPDRPVVAVIGDGSALYSIQALWTAAHLRRPITYLIPNNRSYRILKERLKAFRGTDRYIGMDLRDPPIDFVGLAESFGIRAARIDDPADVGAALREAVASGEPRLLDVPVADGFGG